MEPGLAIWAQVNKAQFDKGLTEVYWYEEENRLVIAEFMNNGFVDLKDYFNPTLPKMMVRADSILRINDYILRSFTKINGLHQESISALSGNYQGSISSPSGNHQPGFSTASANYQHSIREEVAEILDKIRTLAIEVKLTGNKDLIIRVDNLVRQAEYDASIFEYKALSDALKWLEVKKVQQENANSSRTEYAARMEAEAAAEAERLAKEEREKKIKAFLGTAFSVGSVLLLGWFFISSRYSSPEPESLVSNQLTDSPIVVNEEISLNELINEFENKHNIKIYQWRIDRIKEGMAKGLSPRQAFDSINRVKPILK